MNYIINHVLLGPGPGGIVVPGREQDSKRTVFTPSAEGQPDNTVSDQQLLDAGFTRQRIQDLTLSKDGRYSPSLIPVPGSESATDLRARMAPADPEAVKRNQETAEQAQSGTDRAIADMMAAQYEAAGLTLDPSLTLPQQAAALTDKIRALAQQKASAGAEGEQGGEDENGDGHVDNWEAKTTPQLRDAATVKSIPNADTLSRAKLLEALSASS